MVGLPQEEATRGARHHDSGRAGDPQRQDNQDWAHGDIGNAQVHLGDDRSPLRVPCKGKGLDTTQSGRFTALPSCIDLRAAVATSTAAFPSWAVTLVSVSSTMHSTKDSISSLYASLNLSGYHGYEAIDSCEPFTTRTPLGASGRVKIAPLVPRTSTLTS